MAKYEITSPSGKILEIEGDTPPTEQELDEIFSQVDNPKLPDLSLNEDGTINKPVEGRVSKNINLTPSGISRGIAENLIAGVSAPFAAIKNNQSILQAFKNNKENIRNRRQFIDEMPSTKISNFIHDTTAYSLLPEIGAGQGIGRAALNAGAQGALIGGLESAKNNGLGTQNISDAGIAAGIGAALPPVFKGTGSGIKKVVNSEPFKNTVGKGLEVLTSVPKKYIDRALNAELSGSSILNGKFNKDTAYIPVERKLRTALDRLPKSEKFAKQFSELAKKAKTGIDKKLLEKNVELNNVIRNMPDDAGDISTLRENINEGLEKFRFGEVNPALEEAGGVINSAKQKLGFKNTEEINQKLNDYVNKYRVEKGLGGSLNKEDEDIAFNILAQATGKNKNWLKSQLKAQMPKMSTQKRQDFISRLLEETDDKIENFDPAWAERFPEINWENLQGTSDGGNKVAQAMLDRILGRRFAKTAIHPDEQMFQEADELYAKLLEKLSKNPNEQGYSQAINELQNVTRYLDDFSKDLYFNQLVKDFDNIDNIINPKIQPATLHGVKEMLYDRANFGGDNFGNYGNSGIKSMASDINSYLRQQSPEYARINDELKLLNSVKNDLGGPAGINQNTLSTKLRNIGSENNTLSNMDERLMNLNYLLDPEYRFFNDARDLANTQRVQDEMVNLIGANQKLKNPRLLDNITDEGRLNALSQLQRQTGVNFMDELETVRAREALENLLPGQGGGSGSAQGFGNLLRTSIVGGAPVASFFSGNPLPLLGIGAISPKLMAKGTIQNIGRLNNLPQDIPQGLYNLLIQGIGRTAGSEK
jgi:hypothetical protein